METFKVKQENGSDIELGIIKLNPRIRLEADKIYSTSFTEAIEAGVMLRCQVNNLLEERGVTDSKAIKQKTHKLRSELRSLEVQLKSARKEGRKMTKIEGREIALKMRDLRNELNNVGGDLARYYNSTAESVADNERLNYYVYALTVYAETGKNYWSSYESFKEDYSEVKNLAVDAFLKSFYNIDSNADKSLYENSWLIRHGFMNESLQLINEQGRLIDSQNRLINEDGRLINENGVLIDEFGNEIDENGELKVPDGWLEDQNIAAQSVPIKTIENMVKPT